MNARTTCFLVALLASAAAFIVGLSLRRGRAMEMDRLAAVTKQPAVFEADVTRAKERLAVAEREREAARAALAGFRKESAGGPNAGAANPGGPGATVNPDAVRDDPKLQALMLRSTHAGLSQRYGPLFQTLGLTPAQIEKFTELTMKRQGQLLDLESVARTRGKEDAAAFATLRKQVENEYVKSQKELLGETGFRQLQEFDRTTEPRDLVARLAGAAAVDGMPMTLTQAEALRQVVADASGRYQRGERADLRDVDWAKVDLRAAEILSPEQLMLFKTVEPMGGGRSRWMTNFDQAMEAARKSEASKAPGKPTSG